MVGCLVVFWGLYVELFLGQMGERINEVCIIWAGPKLKS